jgi:transcriptional regulator with XRE-family HTH domain
MKRVNQSSIGLKLKKLRHIHGLEQKNVAYRLGIGQPCYSKLECGDTSSHLKYIPLLASFYKINEKYFLEDCVLDQVIDDNIEFYKQYQILVELSNRR